MATVATKATTADEFYEFANRPEHRERRFELEGGEIVEVTERSRPCELHSVVCADTTGLFWLYNRQRKRGRVISNDTGVLLDSAPDTVRGLDVGVYTNSKKYEDLERKYSDELPNVAIEVLAPNDRMGRMVARLNRFLTRGVDLVWLIDPESRNVMIWRTGQQPIVFEEDEEIADLPELPGFRCRVAELFEVMA